MAPLPRTFRVRRREPVLVAPAEPTPHEFKLLSDIDDQETLRFQLPIVMFYRHTPSMEGRDPARIIRDALPKALVPYYPFAGRLREGPGRKLMVECTGEGVVFVEADVDARMEQFDDVLMPPAPYLDELLYSSSECSDILGTPLLFFQVTRLVCGGFILAIRFNHTMCDGPGLMQFLSAVGELARGAPAPNLAQVWAREVLSARIPPRATYPHREYEPPPSSSNDPSALLNLCQRSFFFGPSEISSLRARAPHDLRGSPAFDLVAACVWRARTAALRFDPDEEVRLLSVVSARAGLPVGFYGNSFFFSAVLTKAGKLCGEPFGYAIQLVKMGRSGMDCDEYIRSVADLMVLRGRPPLGLAGDGHAYLAPDVTRAGFHKVDMGWGDAVYGGPAVCGASSLPPEAVSYYVRYKNSKGETGTVVPINLPSTAMEDFVAEIERMTKQPPSSKFVSLL